MSEYKLSDNVIVNIVQLVQLAMITGTDVSDHFRMISLSPSVLVPGKLDLSPDYAKAHSERIESLMEEAQRLAAELDKRQNSEPPAGFVQ
jgi:hypothetical protein